MVNKAFQNAIDISNTSNRDTRVWVNLSVRHLLQGEFYQYVMKALRNSETTADKLGVEIEEQVFKVDNGLLYPFLNQLRDLGIAIALDDFGSDASLQALQRYQYDVIKLDRALVTEFAKSKHFNCTCRRRVGPFKRYDSGCFGVETRTNYRL
jgi:EAL domain-containing protein (putative c-di-GMP-specific phosphodiesterase class I)